MQDDYITRWQEAKNTEKLAQEKRKEIEQKIIAHHGEQIFEVLDPDYKTGSTAITDDIGNQLSVNIPKKVVWDQEKLAYLWDEIASNDGDPREYMEQKLSVPEGRYKAWPEYIREYFTPARTVQAGNPTFSFKG